MLPTTMPGATTLWVSGVSAVVFSRVADPCSFETDPDPGFDEQKLKKFTVKKNNRNCFGSKTTVYLSIGIHKGRPSYKRSLSLSKENIRHSKTWTFLFFSSFVGHFRPPKSGSTEPIKSGFNSDPDPTLSDPDTQPWFLEPDVVVWVLKAFYWIRIPDADSEPAIHEQKKGYIHAWWFVYPIYSSGKYLV
jgi:hypothetical protein